MAAIGELSVYSEKLGELIDSLNSEFAKMFDLKTPFRQEDLEIGKLYGVISVNGLLATNPLRTSPQSSATPRGAFDDRAFSLSLIIATLVEKRLDAEFFKIKLITDIDSAVSALKKTVKGEGSWAYDLEINGEISADTRQSSKPPYPWLINIGCDLLLPVRFYRAPEFGEHAEPPAPGEWTHPPLPSGIVAY